jgi:hypothetical protein
VSELAYRDFYYPLNVFMHILTHEECEVSYLHYGLFDRPDERIGTAQERSTDLLFSRLPAPPARILEAGIGLGTTLARLTAAAYDAVGITPDEKQIEWVRSRYGHTLKVRQSAFESFTTTGTYDCILFQESSQYIDSALLWAKARELTTRVLVLDEFSLRPVDPPGLPSLSRFLTCAALQRFHVKEEIDLSARATPTMDYFFTRIPRYRQRLLADLSLTDTQIDELIESGDRYRELYRSGAYGYRFLDLVSS